MTRLKRLIRLEYTVKEFLLALDFAENTYQLEEVVDSYETEFTKILGEKDEV
jgi:hypothetical protein